MHLILMFSTITRTPQGPGSRIMASDEGSGDAPMPKIDLYGYGSNVDLRCVRACVRACVPACLRACE